MSEGILLYGREKWTIKKYVGSEGDVVVEKNNENDPNKNKRYSLVGNRIRKKHRCETRQASKTNLLAISWRRKSLRRSTRGRSRLLPTSATFNTDRFLTNT